MKRIIFIKSMFENEDVQITSKIVDVAPSTEYQRLKRWNTEVLKRLTPKFTGGKPSKLLKKDYEKLNKIFEKKTPKLTTNIAHDIIKVLSRIL